MKDKNDIRHVSTPRRGRVMDELNDLSVRKVSLDKLVQQDIPYEKMSEISGKSVYEIRRYIGLIQ